MKIVIDGDRKEIVTGEGSSQKTLALYSDEAFRVLANLCLRVGWNQKYSYGFTWLGRPIVQLPEDMIRIQEIIHRVKPDVIVETGVAHGGSLIFYASLCKAIGKGRVIGVDIEIRPDNRQAIESHALSPMITLIEGSSTAHEVVSAVREKINPGETTLVILDSNHSYAHVRDELRLYSPMVSPDSYIVATDGIMRDLADVPNGRPEWTTDNPSSAALDFAKENRDFHLEVPSPPFSEGVFLPEYTYWPNAYLRRIAG
jgi:cephalosporin hydroxylase